MDWMFAFVARVVKCDFHFIKYLSFFYIFSAVYLLVRGTKAPYGRYSKKGLGLNINCKVAWCLQELPSFLIPLLILFGTESPRLAYLPNKILLGAFLLHYFQRTFIFPFLIRGGKPTPLKPFVQAFVFCLCNGYMQAGYLLYHANFGGLWYRQPSLYLGISMFVFGMCVNIHSDHILRNLRKEGETGYKIPKGGLFEYISGANFLGEIIEWLGFAIASWSLPSLAFFCTTAAVIGPRAYQHHQYYCEKFEDYPQDRKAIVPFLL